MRRLLLALLLAAAACATQHTTLSGDLKFGKTVEDDYKSGLDELKDHNYVEASRFFEHVKTKFPFSRYAPLSELRLADVKFDQDRFTEAVDAYQQFLKLHPTHEDADYASFRIGLAHWKDGPSNFILFPPSYEKDLVQVRDAAKSFQGFLASFPQSKYRPEAEKHLAEARKLLTDHEWYVAEFYASRGHWAGVVARLEGLVKEYPGSGREPDALLALARAYMKLDERYRAQQALQQLLVKHPQDKLRPQAEKLLASIR